MAYDKNTDYSKLMKDYLAKGGKSTDQAYKDYEISRNEKISNDSSLNQYADVKTDKYGNAYITNGTVSGLINKNADGTYTIPEGYRYATTDEANTTGQAINQAIGSDYGGKYGISAGNGAVPTSLTANPSASSNNTDDVNSYINQLKQAQYNAKLSALDKAKNNSLSNLTAEQAAIVPEYYGKRNQAAGNSEVGAMNFAQYMAQRGIKGAAGAMPEIYRNAGLQQQIGALNQQEAAANTDIARRKSDVQNAYESDVASAKADTDATALQNLIDAYKEAQAQKVADNAAMGLTSTGQQTLEGQQYADSKADAAKQEWINTIGQYSNDYKAQIDKITNDGDTSNDWQLSYLNAARQQKLQSQAEAKAEAAASESEAAAANYDRALKAWQTSGVATADIAAILGVPVGSKTADYDIAQINAATSRMNAQTSRNNSNKNTEDKPTATEQKNQDFADDYNTLRVMSVKDAMNTMNQNWGDFIAAYGADGAKKLWNTVLDAAIQMGQAKAK